MIIKYFYITTLCLLFLALGCNSDKVASKKKLIQDPELLIGSWEWQSSTYYYTMDGKPYKETPESVGYTITLKFLGDGTVERYRNGNLKKRESYQVKKKKYQNGTVSEEPMLFMGIKEAQFGVNDEKLLISTASSDGPESIYRRLN